jgi:hypothetical protein
MMVNERSAMCIAAWPVCWWCHVPVCWWCVLVVPCAGVLVCMKLSRNSLLLRSRCFAIKLDVRAPETPLAL